MEHLKKFLKDSSTCIKWVFISLITGSLTGLTGSLLYMILSRVTLIRTTNTYIKFCLPLGGIIIILINKLFNIKSAGTNTVIDTIHSKDNLSIFMAPAMFLSTVITHLVGGSAGREGAAMQIGGSLGYNIGNMFKLNERNRNVVTMCGISGAFSALLGTPVAAVFFAMEVASIGIMHYSALLPCSISALTAIEISRKCKIAHSIFSIENIPKFSFYLLPKLLIITFIFSLVSILFCMALHKTHDLFTKYIKNDYLRIISGSLILIILILILKTDDYLGAGLPIIESSLRGSAPSEAFILKIIFTSITLAVGFKGGEIVPSFFIGATLGCVLGKSFGISPSLCAALGMISIFCGVTNCPLTSLLISFELFNFNAVPFFLISVGISYMISGYLGLYKSQKIIYSKVTAQFIDKNVSDT